MQGIKTVFIGYLKYRGEVGQRHFLLHRITGLGMVLFLTIHILDTATIYFYPALYPLAIEIYRTTLFGIGEILLIFCVFFHGVNGLRIAFYDLFAPKKWIIENQNHSSRLVLVITLVFWIPCAVMMMLGILANNYGWPGR